MTSLRAYIITRALLTIPMILILVTLVFFILRIMPGDPVLAFARPGSPPEYLDEIRHNLGLDKPLFLNFRGSTAVVKPERLVLRADAGASADPVVMVNKGEKFAITKRVSNAEGEWIRVSTGEGFEGLITPEQVEWLRRVDLSVSVIETVQVNGQEWVRVQVPTGSLDGWAPVDRFAIQVNIFDSQYFNYLNDLLHLDLGTAIHPRGRPIAKDLREKFPATVELSVAAMLVTILIGVSTGAYAAHKRRSVADYGFRLYSIIIYAIPVFWLGLMLQLIFGVYLGLLPVYGRIGTGLKPETITGLFVVDSILTRNWPALVSALKYLTLPSLTLGLYLSGIFTRLTRANMLETLRQDYVRAARARGLPERVVVYKHALKNAFIPIITMMGLQFALLLAGAVLTETTFSWPGMGLFLTQRIMDRDFPSVQGGVVFFAVIVASVNLIVDIVYALLDPRVRY
jgi:peptide/nickel transport system permease protein